MAFPSTTTITTLGLDRSLAAISLWAGVTPACVTAWATEIGLPGNTINDDMNPNIISEIKEKELEDVLDIMVVPQPPEGEVAREPRKLNMFEKSALRNMCKLATYVSKPPVPETIAVSNKTETKSTVGIRKLKTSNLIDPVDDTEIAAPSGGQLAFWYDCYRELKHGDPLPDRDLSPEQVAAMHARIVTFGQEPYADFSLLTPYGRRMQKRLRHRSWLLQEDGTYSPIEVPGPGSWEAWEGCWKVYEVILLMLRTDEADKKSFVATPICLEAYFENFQQLAREHPECWHLLQAAEDRCRAEHFPRIARTLATKKGTTPSWSEVFVAAAEDDRYWSREVRNPAIGFLARGTRPRTPLPGPVPSVPQPYDNGNGERMPRKRPKKGANGRRSDQPPRQPQAPPGVIPAFSCV